MKRQLLTTLLFSLFNVALVAQWTGFGHLEGGAIKDFCTEGNFIYALSNSCIYESSDEGEHWMALTASKNKVDNFTNIEVTPNAIYAFIADSALLYRSTDRGMSWQYLFGRVFPKNFLGQKISTFWALGDTVLAVTQHAMYRSINKGETWVVTGDFFLENVQSFFQFKNELFAWGGASIFRSSNNGASWVKAYTTIYDFKIVGATASSIYAFYPDLKTIVKSTDGLRTWTKVTGNLSIPYLAQYKGLVEQNDTLSLVFFDPNTTEGCNSKRFTSVNGGVIWYQNDDSTTIPISDINAMLTLPDGRVLFGSAAGVKYSDDSLNTFHSSNDGIKEGEIEDFTNIKGKILISAKTGGFMLDPSTGTWTSINVGQTGNDCTKSDYFYATENRIYYNDETNKGTYQYSDDLGATWNELPKILYWWVYNTATASKNYLWIGSQKPYRLRNGSTEEEQVSLLIPSSSEKISYFTGRDNQLWCITDKKAFAIFDENANLVDYFPPLEFCPLATASTLYYFYDGENAWGVCGTEVYVFRPSDGRWEEEYLVDWSTGVPLYHYNIRDLEVYNGTILITTSKGIFVKEKNANRCYPLAPACPESNLLNAKIVDDHLWVLTEKKHDLYVLPLNRNIENGEDSPKFWYAPNPSSGQLNIQASQLYNEPIQLDILDPSGRRVRALTMSSGNGWSFDLSDLAKGIYLLHMSNAQVNNTVKWVKY
jgi:Secretion system C-terminal sorting domain